jgi:hypothetical protein
MVSDMRGKLATVAVLTVAVAACTSEAIPATTPPSTQATTTTVTTTLPPMTTTRAAATSTALDHVAEIETIFQDLEERRLQALYDGDREAFRSLFANPEYLERSMVLFELVEFVGPPIPGRDLSVRVVHDGRTCLAAEVETSYEGILKDGGTGTKTVVLERLEPQWGISYVGEDWACVGPHPFSS